MSDAVGAGVCGGGAIDNSFERSRRFRRGLVGRDARRRRLKGVRRGVQSWSARLREVREDWARCRRSVAKGGAVAGR